MDARRIVTRTCLVLVISLFSVIGAQDLNHYASVGTSKSASRSRCIDDQGRAQRCIPEFVNAAFNGRVEVTNTCGVRGPTEYCLQTGATGAKKSCEICDASNPHLTHPPEYLTDFNNNDNETWWQSETMYEGIGRDQGVNLTFHLGKAFEVTYVRLKFHSSRPESFAIYKRTSEDGPWIPYQYYSATCRDTYNIPESSYITKDDETKAICTSEHSDISPLTGASVPFSTLEGRPSAYDFENSLILQEWVTATDIRITLDRMNTFGDEIFGDPHVLKSYYYAISDFAVGGRCKCNGHASECVASTGSGGQRRLVCRCEHNTAGPDCNECRPFYNDQPWGRATANDVHECKPCNCNGRSNKCFFDKALWEQTGHGGHCIDCTDNTDGPHCERCKENFYQLEDGRCLPCQCDPVGSRSLQCNKQGQCLCKPGVEGQRCDRCAPNYYEFSPQGCRPCGCNVAGSIDNTPSCDPETGDCRCKDNVEGRQCDRCKLGFFDLQLENEFGCLECFCYGHSSICRSAPDYSLMPIESTFTRDKERWRAQDRSGNDVPFHYNAIIQNIGVKALRDQPVYFVAPERYLGDQRASYNQFLTFTLRIGEEGPRATVEDIVLEGAGMTISQPIFGQGNPIPTISNQAYKFRLHEHIKYGWNPRLSAHDFIKVLTNLTALKIRATYTPEGTGFIDDVRLESAHRLNLPGQRVTGIEMCTCPEGYVGQFCESCAPGFRHDPPGGGSFSACVPCNCHGHADYCDPQTGRCICQHNTAGDTCERCASGYYGTAIRGTPDDCVPCPCPDQGACVILPDEQVACLQCPQGYAGYKCDLCVDGYFGDPLGHNGPETPCKKCDCSGNVDPNAIGNCDTLTGECLKCIYNTGGRYCERCLPGYYGDPHAPQKGDCKACGCHPLGTYPDDSNSGTLACSQVSGQCSCKPNVVGRQCDRCEDGFWNLASGEGCTACNCDPTGSFNHTCDESTGQCYCRPGVTGKHCDTCLAYHYGFSIDGCKSCDCDRIGSLSLQCDPHGQCECRPNVEGRRCDRCKENKYNKEAGCVDCPPCYTLVQDAVNDIRDKLSKLEGLVLGIEANGSIGSDEDFREKLQQVMDRVDKLLEDAQKAEEDAASLINELNDLREKIKGIQEMAGKIAGKIEDASEGDAQGQRNITLAEELMKQINQELNNLRHYLKTDGAKALEEANKRAETLDMFSQEMSNISREARQLAEGHEQTAKEIDNTAKHALNTSNEAYELAKKAVDAYVVNKDAIQELRNRVNMVGDMITKATEAAEKAHAEATKAHDAALDIGIATEGDPPVPQIDVKSLKDEAQSIIDDVRSTRVLLDQELKNNEDLLATINDLAKEAKDLLNEAERQQQITDELLADTDATCQKGKDAIEFGEKIVEDANKTLEIIMEFDAHVKESQDKAKEALQNIDFIEKLIKEAEEKATEADNALSGALSEADQAEAIALEAQRIAEQASMDAGQIKNDAEKTKDFAGDLRGRADDLQNAIENTSQKMDDREQEAKKDEVLTGDALENAAKAKESANDAIQKVKGALDKVDHILDILGNMEDVNTVLLEELEASLAKAEQELKDADLENRMNNLIHIRETQLQWMRNYDDEIDQLKKDVANIKDISESLPDGCFNPPIKLEP